MVQAPNSLETLGLTVEKYFYDGEALFLEVWAAI